MSFCRLCYKKPRDERFASHILPVSTLIQHKMCRDWKFWQFLTRVLFICILGSCHRVSADCYDNVAYYCFQFHILHFYVYVLKTEFIVIKSMMHILSRFELLEELQKEYKNVDIELSIGDRQSILIVKGNNYNVTVLLWIVD